VDVIIYLLTVWLLYYCDHGGVGLMGLKPSP